MLPDGFASFHAPATADFTSALWERKFTYKEQTLYQRSAFVQPGSEPTPNHRLSFMTQG